MSKSVVTATKAARAKSLSRGKKLHNEQNQKHAAEEAVVAHQTAEDAQALHTSSSNDNTLAGDFSFSGVMADAASTASMMDVTAGSLGGTGLTSFAQDSGGEGGGLFGGDSTPLIIGGVVLVGAGIAIAASGGDDDDDTVAPPPPAANKAPTITAPATVNIAEDATTTGKIAATDPDGDAITFAVKGTAPQGFVLNKDGSYTIDTKGSDYQPLKAGETKDYTVTFTVSDGKGGNTDGTLTYKVTGVDEAPATKAVAISGAGTNANSTDDDVYTIAAGNYSHTITGGFDVGLTATTGDKLVGPAGSSISIDNSNFTDGKVVISFTSPSNQTSVITLEGLTAAQDGAIFGPTTFNTVFGAGAIS